jgi:hydroxyacylglutathione hydrolase
MSDRTRVIDLGFVNAYLVCAADGDILIDTGISPQWSRMEADLLGAGSLPDCLKLVIITHGDRDHTGSCAELQRKYHARIAMHAADADMARTGVPQKRQGRGLFGKLLMRLRGRAGGGCPTFEPDILLEDGQELDGYGWAARVIHTPGHTKGSIAILSDDGELFAGDTVANRGRPALAPFIENAEELRASLALLKGLDARIVYPGHGKPFPFDRMASIAG